MGKIKENIGSDLKSAISDEIMNVKSFDVDPIEAVKSLNDFTRDIVEDEDGEGENEPQINFYDSTYIPEDKSIIGAYMVTDESDKMIEVLNIMENENQSRQFADGVTSYNLKVEKVKLPKSQIEIIGDVEGKEGMVYIKIPYWLFKKQNGRLNIRRIEKNKRLSFNNSQLSNRKFMETIDDNDVERMLSIIGGDDDVERLKYYITTHMGKKKSNSETTEATSSGGAGQYSQPLFSGEEPKKIEATEATSSASSGQYSTPAFVAKDSKNWRGNKKPQIPGGKFVKIKDKCKKFPYCNQGDIKALKLFENDAVKKAISNICEKFDVSENVVKSIIVHEYENKLLNK